MRQSTNSVGEHPAKHFRSASRPLETDVVQRDASETPSITRASTARTWPFAALAVALVLFRSYAPAWYEGYHFDSDQAVIGLMAKHLSELRTFPLFVYGQHYILGVESWMAAPLFLLGGPTVFMLRLPLVFVNSFVAVLLVIVLVREMRLQPWLAFVAALPFILPTPMTASHLVEVLGYSVEPILYVLLLWIARRRPILFGLVLAIGFLHREFTAYAIPALVVVMAIERTLWTRKTLERAFVVAATGAAVWALVGFLKGRVDVLGPSTGPVENAPLSTQAAVWGGHLCLEPHQVLGRATTMWRDLLAGLFGAVRRPLYLWQVNSTVETGSSIVAWLIGVVGLLMIVRIFVLLSRDRRASGLLFGAYLAMVGVEAAVAYPLACDVPPPGFAGIVRYVLMVLLVPVGFSAIYLARERAAAWRGVVVAAVVAWTAINAVDNVRAIRQYATRHAPPNHRRLLADYLVAHNIKYSRADYWDAYITDFFAREQVMVASTWKVRVREYQQAADAHPDETATITRGTCAGDGIVMDAWCIRRPGRDR